MTERKGRVCAPPDTRRNPPDPRAARSTTRPFCAIFQKRFLNVNRAGVNPHRLISFMCFCITLLLGALDVWLHRFEMWGDGVSYRDMAAGVLDGRWSSLLNGCWSPGYPAVLAIGMGVIPNEQFAVKAMNYLLFVCASLGLLYLLRTLRPTTPWLIICWTWWMFVSVSLMGVYQESPDFAVAAIVFLTAGILIEAIRDDVYHPLLFGATIGLGYLVKAAFVPIGLLAFVFMLWKSRRTAAVSAACVVLVAAPYVIGLSHSKGRFTIGDNGWFNWASHIQHIPVPIWHGDALNGTPRHPIQQVSSNPEIDVFRQPFTHATYPPHYDPTYWAEGVRIRYSLPLLLQSVRSNIPVYVAVFKQKVSITCALLLGCLAVMGSIRLNRTSLVLLTLGITGTLLFLPMHMEVRYIGAYMMLVVLGLVSTLTVRPRFVNIAAVLLALVVAYQLDVSLLRLRAPEDFNIKFAQQLGRAGLKPGDEIAVIGDAYRSAWARSLKLRIVAQVPDPNVLREDQPQLASLASRLENSLHVVAVIGQMHDNLSIVSIAPDKLHDMHPLLSQR